MNNTKEIVTELGTKIVIKTFLSYNDLEASLKIEDTFEKSKAIMQIAIISVNGITEKPYEFLRDLPISEYIAVSKEVTAIVTGNFPPAK